MTSFITVNPGGPDIPDGVYPVILTAISDVRTVTAQRGAKAGQDVDLIDWTFAIDGGEHEGVEISASTSTASGPKSKMFSYLTALSGGRAPTIGQSFEKAELIGRTALATIRKDESGWPRIENLGALPTVAPKAAPAKAEAGAIPF